MPKKLTTQDFIAKATVVHGKNKYDYSLVEYAGTAIKVKIICKVHGVFEQIPNSHLSKYGCPDCGCLTKANKRLLTSKEFVRKAKLVHGNSKYGYELVDYKGCRDPVQIICSIHGVFSPRPNDHLNGHGCSYCSGKLKSSTEEFIERAEKIHNGRYQYDLVKYNGCKKSIKIRCRVHGVFLQTPDRHLNSRSGCLKCAGVQKSNTEEFIKKAKEVHGEHLYSYELTEYADNKSLVKITCNIHGVFETIPGNHLMSHGCPACAKTGFNPSAPGILYCISFESQLELPIIKIGITNRSVEDRIRGMHVFHGFSYKILGELRFGIGAEAYQWEQLLIQEHKNHQYHGDKIMQNGNTELFHHSIIPQLNSLGIFTPPIVM